MKWGGDAVLLLFDGPDHARTGLPGSAPDACLRCARSAGSRPAAGRVTCGCPSGSTAGSSTSSWSVTRRTTASCSSAVRRPAVRPRWRRSPTPGQIAISPETAAQLDPRVVGAPAGDGFLLRSLPDVPVVGVPPAQGPRRCSTCPSVVPPGIREHLLAQSGDAEHRTIAVAFVQFSGTDDLLERSGPAALAAALDAVVRNVQDATAAHGVTFFETDINRDGGKIMLTAGAPRSLGHEEDRMLRATRLVVDRVGELPLRIGVNRGPVFSGDFGPFFRKTYSVKGDAINLAARVMGKAAPGQLLATYTVRRALADAVRDRAAAALHGQGQVAAGRGGQRRAARRRETGRAPRTPRSSVARPSSPCSMRRWRARAPGAGALVDLVGEPGIGKSRLVAELRSHATDVVVRWPRARSTSRRRRTSRSGPCCATCSGCRPTPRSPRSSSGCATGSRCNLPDLLPWIPLVGVPLDLAIPDTSETARLDPRFRKTRTRGGRRPAARPRAAHADAPRRRRRPSHGRCVGRPAHAPRVRRARPAVARPDHPSRGGRRVPRRAREGHRGSARAPGAEAALALLGARTGEAPLPPHELQQLVKRAGGNPLFLRALVEARREPRVVGRSPRLSRGPHHEPDRPAAPGRANRASLRLGPRARVLRGAAAQRCSTVEAVPAGRPTMRRLSYFLSAEGHGRYRFQHELIRDAAYEGLPFRRRRVLHARVGETLEGAAHDPDEQSELLSLHFFEAGALDKAWRYSRVAGERAGGEVRLRRGEPAAGSGGLLRPRATRPRPSRGGPGPRVPG